MNSKTIVVLIKKNEVDWSATAIGTRFFEGVGVSVNDALGHWTLLNHKRLKAENLHFEVEICHKNHSYEHVVAPSINFAEGATEEVNHS